MQLNLSNFSVSGFKVTLLLLVFLIYGNSINNEYSLDDNIVVDGNQRVNEGFKGILEIFSTHHAIDRKQNYGYRPIVLTTFAIEKHFFRHLTEKQTIEEKNKVDRLTQANISHFINVLLYAITCILLFSFLQLLFKEYNILLPILITLLFVVHPLHTEPVANIKSRDELIMFLGMLLALTNFLKYSLSSKIRYLLYASLFFLVAMLSKITSVILIGILPVILYYSKVDLKKQLLCLGSLVGLVFLSITIKKGILIGPGVREINFYENPLHFQGDFLDRVAMGLYCAWFYLKMLIFPKHMSFYYGYSQIPIPNWTYYQVWLAALFYIPLLLYGIIKLKNRNVAGLGIVIWLGVMFSYLNVISPVVGIVAERFTYVFSLGFCIVIGYLLLRIFKIDLSKDILKLNLPLSFVAIVLIILGAYSTRVAIRNPNWHDYMTTYFHDIAIVPNSAKAHSLIATKLFSEVINDKSNPNNQEYIREIIFHYKRAIEIDSTYKSCYNNLGSAYIEMLGDNEKGIYYCQKAIALDNDYLEPNLSLAIAYDRVNLLDSAYNYYIRAIEIDPTDGRSYSPLNTLLSKYGKVESGIARLNQLAQTSKNPKYIFMNIAKLYSLDGINIDQSIAYFVKAFEMDQDDKVLCEHIANLYLRIGDEEKANYFRTILYKLKK